MPTRDEMQELLSNCTWSWVLRDGVKGYLGTSNRNGKTIFLPAAGYQTDADDPSHLGYGASYWTANQDGGSYYAYVMAYRNNYYSGAPGMRSGNDHYPFYSNGAATVRYFGRSIRAVGYR
jgi:hypothetical protein